MPFDFSSPTFVLGLIGAGAAVVLFIYSLQVRILPIINGLFGSGKNSADEQFARLLTRYHKEQLYQDPAARNESMISPRLQLIRTAQRGEELKCLVVNNGGTAIDLEIKPAGALEASIEPAHALENGQTSSVSLRKLTPHPNQLRFQLSYKDSLGLRVIRTYVYSETENNFIEV